MKRFSTAVVALAMALCSGCLSRTAVLKDIDSATEGVKKELGQRIDENTGKTKSSDEKLAALSIRMKDLEEKMRELRLEFAEFRKMANQANLILKDLRAERTRFNRMNAKILENMNTNRQKLLDIFHLERDNAAKLRNNLDDIIRELKKKSD